MGLPPPIHAPLATSLDVAPSLLPTAALLDVRSAERFSQGHHAGAGNIAPEDFKSRRAELPPRDVTLLVLHDEPANAEAAATALGAMGYSQVHWLDAPVTALPGAELDRGPAARLWRPSQFLERILPLLPRGRVLDVAAGSGRESVFLALNGFDVEAWDHAPEALERAEALAVRSGVQIRTRVVDLEKRGLAEPDQFEVVMVFRFLHRTLLPWLERAVAPGGALVYETYREGQEVHGRPKHPRFLLRPGELSSSFPALSVVLHEEPDIPGGPVMSRVLARRPLIAF